MEDTNNTPPPTGEQPDRTTDQSSSSQLIPNETTTRTGEQTCTQKLTIPSLEKHDSSSANLWWRKFVQYIKMTKDIDLSQMVNPKEILPQFRDQLELEFKGTFLWAIGQSALSEMTKNGERTRTQHSTVTQTIQPISTAFHSRTERTT